MLEFSRREKWFIGLVYGIPIVVLGAALAMAFVHAKDWAARHNRGLAWEHWAFAITVELPALLGLLLLTLWPKIGAGRKPVIPRVLFGLAAGMSLFVQQAYAGPGASPSARFVAGVPSVVAGLFLEIVFWVMGLIEEAKESAKREAAGPRPVVAPPPPMMLPTSPLVAVPPAVPADVPPDTTAEAAPASPWTTPPRTPLPAGLVPPDRAPDVLDTDPRDRGDIPQVTALVPPPVSPSAGGVDMGGQDLLYRGDNGALSPTGSGGHVPLDNPEVDTDQGEDTSVQDGGTPGLDPTDLEVWAHHRNGKTKSELAAMYGCHEKTIQRRLSKVRKSTPAEEERSNA